MEIINCSLPYPSHITTLFFECLKDNLVIDIIKHIWNYYISIEPYFAKFIVESQNKKLQKIFTNNDNCWVISGPINANFYINTIFSSPGKANVRLNIFSMCDNIKHIQKYYFNVYDYLETKKYITYNPKPQIDNFLFELDESTIIIDERTTKTEFYTDFYKNFNNISYIIENTKYMEITFRFSRLDSYVNKKIYYYNPVFTIMAISLLNKT